MTSSTGSGAGIAAAAAAAADPTRAAMLELLMDGRAWTVSELARGTGVAPSTATEHAHRLVASGWCAEVRQGRHRYLRLAGPEAAALLESLGALRGGTAPGPASASLRGHRDRAALRAGRTCYGHLAGELGVAVAERWSAEGYVGEGALTDVGRVWLEGLGVDCTPHARREALRPCLDWTERRDHLAGVIADRFCALLLARGWLVRGQGRAVRLTPEGRSALRLDLP